MTNKQSTHVYLAVAFVLGGVLAASIATGAVNKKRMLDMLSWFGGAYSNSYVALERDSRASTSSEYLLVLSASATPASYRSYIEQHPEIEYLSESVYPNTIRVALQIPVTDAVNDLKAQPFVGFVVRNLPLFFCH